MSKKKDKEELKETNNPFNNDIDLDNSENVEQAEENQEKTEKAENSGLQEKYDQLNNQYVRLAADFDNYRKRQAQERENLLKYGAEETLKKLIEV